MQAAAVSWFCVGSLLLGMVLPGCAKRDREDRFAPRTPVITRDAIPAEPDASAVEVIQEPSEETSRGQTVEAMVGQVAGRPVYAHEVLEGMEAQLATLGERLSPLAFRQQAQQLIYRSVVGLIATRLLEDDAMRLLDARQRAQIDNYIQFKRGELLRKYGHGSLALAQRTFFDETGQSLDEYLREQRIAAIVDYYQSIKLRPLINVSRRDIERFYRDNYARFNPPPKRSLQFIYAVNEEDASWFNQQLADGSPFDELARDEKNAYRGKANLYTTESTGQMFGDSVDSALEGLQQGQWAGPLPNRGQQWFVHLVEFDQPKTTSLFEAQVDIERELRNRQGQAIDFELSEARRLNGSYTDEREMAEAVYQIVYARYASPR